LTEICTTKATPSEEEPGEPYQSTLVQIAKTYDDARDAHQRMTIDSLITVIELALIILHEAPASSVEQTRAKRLLQDALKLHPQGFTALKTDHLMSNVDRETLLILYLDTKRLESKDQQIISPFSQKKLDDWFRGLDNYYQNLLLDVLIP
jgi:hypothetical protein